MKLSECQRQQQQQWTKMDKNVINNFQQNKNEKRSAYFRIKVCVSDKHQRVDQRVNEAEWNECLCYRRKSEENVKSSVAQHKTFTINGTLIEY